MKKVTKFHFSLMLSSMMINIINEDLQRRENDRKMRRKESDKMKAMDGNVELKVAKDRCQLNMQYKGTRHRRHRQCEKNKRIDKQ